MEEQVKCPKCDSENWRCYDEQTHWYIDTNPENDDDDDPFFQFPVGYLVCTDCQNSYVHIEEFDHSEYIGNDSDLLIYQGLI